MYLLITLLVIAIVIALYFISLYASAKIEVEAQPRTPMFTCDKHGMFRKEHAITLKLDDDLVIEQCPFCYDEKQQRPLDLSVNI